MPGAAGLLFGSRALVSWGERLPDGWGGLQAALAGWDRLMQGAGLTIPYDWLHAWARSIVEASF